MQTHSATEKKFKLTLPHIYVFGKYGSIEKKQTKSIFRPIKLAA